MSDLEFIQVKSYEDGPDLPDFFIAQDKALSELALKLGLKFRSHNGDKYNVGENPVHPELAALYLELHRTKAQNVARHAVHSGMIRSNNSNVPIIYPPDGGIVVAHGMERGIDYFSDLKPHVFSTVKKAKKPFYRVPPEALAMGAESGTLILCDDVISEANTMIGMLNSCKDMPEGTRIFIYASHAKGLGNVMLAGDYIKLCADKLATGSKQDNTQGKFPVTVVVSNITGPEISSDLLEIPDIIENVDSPHTNHFRSMLRRRPIRPITK